MFKINYSLPHARNILVQLQPLQKLGVFKLPLVLVALKRVQRYFLFVSIILELRFDQKLVVFEVGLVEDVVDLSIVILVFQLLHLFGSHRHQLSALLSVEVDENVVRQIRNLGQQHVGGFAVVVSLVAMVAVVHGWIAWSLSYLSSAVLIRTSQVVCFIVILDKRHVPIHDVILVLPVASLSIHVYVGYLRVHFGNQSDRV
jgi:hypothetical protein